MSDPKGAERTASARGTKRRSTIYGDRRAITLRMGAELNERLMALCDEIHTPANTHVNALISAALGRTDPATASLKRVGQRGEPKTTLTLRLEPDLHARLNEYCGTAGLSVNAFVCGIVQKDLRQRNR